MAKIIITFKIHCVLRWGKLSSLTTKDAFLEWQYQSSSLLHMQKLFVIVININLLFDHHQCYFWLKHCA